MPEFTPLVSQDVRDYWSHEEQEFTPWLAREIEAEEPSNLENTLGLDLEVLEREKNVGKYNVDIYGRVADDGRTVIIENQLTVSDHDHLGKAMAYAAGVDADIIVWIAPRFNDEHTDAFQWLNSNSREGIDFFAIRLEVWRIGDSDPAVRLNPIEEPSEWKEKAKRTSDELSDRDKRREEFWTELRDRINSRPTSLRARKPRPRHHYSNPIGKAGFHMSFAVYPDEHELCIALIIEDDADAYYELEAYRSEIEGDFDEPLLWIEPEETRSGNMRSRIELRTNGHLENRDKWDTYLDWFIENGEQFHETFGNRIQQLN
ncbi:MULTISPECIES: DUF4268 domain-containing protein [Halorussus]|uniref:DUF4268 domain-containing protein n=1 Tax=Halorussus TaxID=1070314 RepID=UPI00209DC67E|nr:DUF4268 domain-containing protein [Halorussus vallis]USZ75002.1 DUF4268 domain-containing protein [Halorussus vallis]